MNLQDTSCLTASSSSEKQIVTSVSVVISASSFEKRGIQDLDIILEVILEKQRERQHHVKRCSNSASESCVLEGCFCGIEEVRQTLKQVLCGRSKTQFVPFDEDLYDFIETNCHEKFEKLRNLCILFKEHKTDYGFIIEFESKMDTSSAHLQSLLSDLKSQYHVLEFHKTNLMTFDQIRGFMRDTETVKTGEVDLVLDRDNGLVKIVGSCDAVFRTRQRYEEHMKTITSDSATTLYRKNFENSFEEENLDDNDHTSEIPERNESHGSDVLPTVSRIKPEEIEIDIRQNENIKLEGTNCGNENAFQTGEHYSETSHDEKEEIINEEDSERKDTCSDINKSILKTVDSATTQNTSKIYDKLDMEKLCGEDDRIANKEPKCCEIEKIPEINGGDDKVFRTGEHYSECKNYKNQNVTDIEKNLDPLCDKTRISCSCFVPNHNETCSKIIVDCKENILPSMENDRKEPGTVIEMMNKTQMENIPNFAPKENGALELKNDAEIQPLFKQEDIQQISSEIVEPIANQNSNNNFEILDTENLCGEEDKTTKKEPNCCHIVADPEINSGEDSALLTREQYGQSRKSEGQSSADTEKTFDLLIICDKAKMSHASHGAINSEMTEGSLKEGTTSFVEYGVEEPITMKKMITESEAENIDFISQVKNTLLSRDQTDIKVQIDEELQQVSSEAKGLDMRDHVTSARMPLLQQCAEDGTSLKNDDLHENDTIKTITDQQQPFSKHLSTIESVSGREETSEAHQIVNVLNSKTNEEYVCRGKTDENVVPQLDLVQQSKATEMTQISQVLGDFDQSTGKSSQMESTDNIARANQKYGTDCNSVTALDSDSDEIKDAAALCVTEKKGNKYEELSINECDKLVGEEIPEQRQNYKIGKIKQVLYSRQEEIFSENLRCFIGGQEQKEIMKEPNQSKNSKCLDDGR